jgi:hypothetical protein
MVSEEIKKEEKKRVNNLWKGVFIYSSFPKLKLTKKNNRSFIYNFTF